MTRQVHPLAGLRPSPDELVTVEQMRARYFNPDLPLLPVKNGTSGHRGLTGPGFSDMHVAAITQALIDIRRARGTFGPDLPPGLSFGTNKSKLGPIVIGKDVRFTSDFAQRTAVEVFAGNGMPVIIQKNDRSTPTPVISHAILKKNNAGHNVEGIVITASHNPPDEAGIKSNGLNGGPNTRTKEIDELAAVYLSDASKILRIDYGKAIQTGLVVEEDFLVPYIEDLQQIIRIDVLRGQKFGVSPLGGAAHGYYEEIAHRYGIDLHVVLGEPDPASGQKTRDWDGKLRGDPSSAFVMQAFSGFREKLAVPFLGANDNDADRFGGEDADEGTLNPNHVICVLFDYLARERNFHRDMGIGRTIGTTHMVDRIAKHYGRSVSEVNVGFKYYVDGLISSRYVLAAEESAGLCFPRLDGSPWITEKDGIAAVLLIMEVIATTGKTVGQLYNDLVHRFGPHQYERIDAPASAAMKKRLAQLQADPDTVKKLLLGKRIAGKAIERLVIGDGIKVVLVGGVWVLKRASGTENIIKDYREERGNSLDTARLASREIGSILGLDT